MYLDIFEELVEILHKDYAGCLDKKGCDKPDLYCEKIKEIQKQKKMLDSDFVGIVRDYLLDFKDLHISFNYADKSKQSNKDVGFAVRRYKDTLYVVSNEKENRVKPGDAITALNDKSVPELVKVHSRQLMNAKAERENWNSILPLYDSIQLTNASGGCTTLELKEYEKDLFKGKYSLNELTRDTLLLTLTDFMDHNAISDLISKNEQLLTTHKNLIIDVRINKGGSDLAYFDLLPYLFEGEEINLNSFDEGTTMLTNCTTRNVELRIKLLKQAFSSIEDAATLSHINNLIKSLEENKNKGFVEIDFTGDDNSFLLKTKSGPEKVILLTDVYCGSSGDSFVETCKHSSKVTVVGRPTLGLNDYANVAVMGWENKFELWYPTSKLSVVDEGKGMNGIGIQPDIYIPWTPNHFEEDIDLKKALELLA
ncbi:S41 family peptidase [Virgibacillus halodenitrificans]|uniref:S41 family peptidase n=1 Tax=Virgibacillus halodenitrificans TaxID=1482 RepID=UPI00031F0AD3|nr:S41 family peptidase [Virgibacillus halodenitrificans]